VASPTDWHITHDATDDETYAILTQDRVWNCFALADLQPPLRQYSQFAIAWRDVSNEYALCLILRHPIIGQVLSPFGSEEGVAAILKAIPLPAHPLLQVQEIHMLSFRRYYRPVTEWKRLLRMAVTRDSLQSFPSELHPSVKQLTIADLPALKKMYAENPGSGFSADLFAQGLYFGVYEGERIVAAGGTHALAPAYGIAVLGNVLTVAEARRRGYATAITGVLVATLFKQQFSLIVLNVFEENSNAIRIYQGLGFRVHSTLLTGRVILLR
jgi:ribosomal protein S18 acetylase RimI-like enzyme